MTSRWVTREGVVIPIQRLEDAHLTNIIRMLRRNYGVRLTTAQRALRSLSVIVDGDLATYIDVSLQEIEEITVDQLLTTAVPAWSQLVAEAAARGLEAEQRQN